MCQQATWMCCVTPPILTHSLRQYGTEFSNEADFAIWQWIEDDRPVIASFTAHGWPFQIFGQAKPVKEQSIRPVKAVSLGVPVRRSPAKAALLTGDKAAESPMSSMTFAASPQPIG